MTEALIFFDWSASLIACAPYAQTGAAMEKLKFFSNGEYRESQTTVYYELHNPSTGEVTGMAPRCTEAEVKEAVEAAKAAYPSWSATPVAKRTQILYRVRELLMEHMEELTMLVARENGKTWSEAEGDVLKAKEGTELATQAPSLMMGDSLMDASSGFDTVQYREPMVFSQELSLLISRQ